MTRTRGRVVLAVLVAVGLGLYAAWGTVMRPQGDQRVAYTPAERTCTDDPAGFTFCVYRAAQGTDGRVAYHLHGRNLDAQAWNDDTYYTSMVQARWAEQGVRPPIVVGVSFGPVWVLAAQNAAPKSGLLEVFRDRVLPAVEAQTGPPRARLVFGESMGGVNALAAGLSLPGLFSRVVALCPPIYETSPFAEWGEIWDTLKRTGADPKLVLALRTLAPDYFADEAAWAAFSPLAAVQGPPPAGAPSLYVSVGLYDAYGSYAGAERLAQDARRNGWRTTWRPLYGGHCATDVESVAAALATDD